MTLNRDFGPDPATHAQRKERGSMNLRYIVATPFFWLGFALSWPGFWLMALGTLIAERGDGRKLFH